MSVRISTVGVMASAIVAIALAVLVTGMISGMITDRMTRALTEELAEWTGTEEDGMSGLWKDHIKSIRATYYGSFGVAEREFLSQCDKKLSEEYSKIVQRLGYGRADYRGEPFLWYAWVHKASVNFYLSFYISIQPSSDDMWILHRRRWGWDNNRPDGWAWLTLKGSETDIPELRSALALLEEQEFFSSFRPAAILD